MILLAKQQGGAGLAELLGARFPDPEATLRGVPTNKGEFADEDYNYVEPLVVAEGLEQAEAAELVAAIAAAGGLARVL